MEPNSDGSYAAMRRRHVAYVNERMPHYIARLAWSRAQIETEQTGALRALLKHATEHSPWHRQRLAHIDIEGMAPAGLAAIPPMTKSDLMTHWDSIVADRRCTLAAAEAHLAMLTTDAYFLGDCHVIASGGSSGQRGVFLYDWHGWAASWLGLMRGVFAVVGRDPKASAGPWAAVAAGRATHATGAVLRTFSDPTRPIALAPVTLALSEIVDALNRMKPSTLVCYASMLPVLSEEARSGRLNIEPKLICSTGEPLLPEMRAAAEAVWSVPVLNSYATSESIGEVFPCEHGPGFHIGEDLNIVELADEKGRPVPCGVRSAKILLTNLYNKAMPLIRYEIADEFTASCSPCACGAAYLKVDDVQGRAEEIFTYSDGIKVHPHSFRSILGSEPSIVAYQVRQTTQGANIDVVSVAEPDLERLRSEILDCLRRIGLSAPNVSLRRVDAIDRQDTGKLKRFVAFRG
jgi:phenylacetate-CoA ligase